MMVLLFFKLDYQDIEMDNGKGVAFLKPHEKLFCPDHLWDWSQYFTFSRQSQSVGYLRVKPIRNVAVFSTIFSGLL